MTTSTDPRPVRLTVRAKPRAKQSRIVRAEGLEIDVALAAPPVDGAANEELIATIARTLRIPKRAVVIVQGAASKNKVVDVAGPSDDEVRERLRAAVTE